MDISNIEKSLCTLKVDVSDRLDIRVEEAILQTNLLALQTLKQMGVSFAGKSSWKSSVMTLAAANDRDGTILSALIAWGILMEGTEVLVAVQNNKSHLLPILDKHGALFQERLIDGTFALLLSISQQDMKCFSYLMQRREDILIETNLGNTALKEAVRVKNKEMVLQLMERGAHPQTQDSCKKENAFMTCAEVGSLELMQLLIEKGGDLNERDRFGHSALTRAVLKKHLVLLQYLIDKGANINLPFFDGETPLILAAKLGSLSSVRALVGHSADLFLTGKQQKTALQKARGGKVQEYLRRMEAPFAVHAPLEEIKRVMISDLEGMIASYLQKHPQGDVNQVLIEAEHPLIFAVTYGCIRLARYLVTCKVCLEAQSLKTGDSALICAIEQEDLLLIKLLVEAGAKVCPKASDLASQRGFFDVNLAQFI